MIYAVITGDIVDSSQVNGSEKNQLIDSLKESFQGIKKWQATSDDGSLPKFAIFRGDSFQGLLSNPADALRASIFIRSGMRKNQPTDKETNWDVRLAVGIGPVDHLPENISEGDGPAYRKSGPILDDLKGDYKLAITTPWEQINGEFKTSCALLDAIIAKWTAQQAEIVWLLLQEKKAKTIAEELDISQAAVHYRVKGAGWFAVEQCLERYKAIIKKNTQ